jgi:hypothetical protein
MRPPGASRRRSSWSRSAGANQFRDREAGAEADLKNPVGRLHIEQRDRPAVALPVGRAVGIADAARGMLSSRGHHAMP